MRRSSTAAIVEEDPDWVVTRDIGHLLMQVQDPVMVITIRLEMVKEGSSKIPSNLASIISTPYMPQNETEN